jgi:hypothetical protein
MDVTNHVVIAVLMVATSAHAQTRTDVRAAITPKDDVARVVSTWGKHSNARLEINDGKPIVVSEVGAAAAIATGHGKTVIALDSDNGVEPFEIRVLDGKQASKPATLARPNERWDMPFAVAIAVTPDGFAVFLQEVQSDDATAAHTYLATLDADGKPVGAATEIAVPWALGDAAWDGTGFHLALYYNDGRGVRLSMVTTSADGAPRGHPDWASKSGVISEAHLVASDGKVRAFYRNGEHLYEADVTRVGSWGQEPAAPKDRGALAWSQTIAITATGDAKKVRGAAR